LIDGIHPADRIIVTFPWDLVDRMVDSRAFSLGLSDGINRTGSPVQYHGVHKLDVTLLFRRFYLGDRPSTSPIFQPRIDSREREVNLYYCFWSVDSDWTFPPTDEDIKFAAIQRSSAVMTIVFPASIWDSEAPTAPGVWGLMVGFGDRRTDDADKPVFYRVPRETSPTLEVISPSDGVLGTFSAISIPSISATVVISGNPSANYEIYVCYTYDPDFHIKVPAGTNTLLVVGRFWDHVEGFNEPGQHFIEIFTEQRSGDETFFDITNKVTLTYNISNVPPIISGVFTISYTGQAVLKLSPTDVVATVKLPLTINVSGYSGAGPLTLEYSALSPPIWISYRRTIATGPAISEFDRPAFLIA
jgi:hypothetical protein